LPGTARSDRRYSIDGGMRYQWFIPEKDYLSVLVTIQQNHMAFLYIFRVFGDWNGSSQVNINKIVTDAPQAILF
jgi:hypothetical protein